MLLRRLLLAVLILVPSVALSARQDAAEKAYQAARRGYYTLKDDAARRKMRHHWLNAVERFEEVAKSHPKSPRAPDALYTAAELLNELSRISRLDEDLKRAMDHYRTLLDGYATHSLMDDAAIALARIYSDRIGNTEAARRVLERAATYKKGDRGSEILALAGSLSPGAPPLRFGVQPTPPKAVVKETRPAVVAKVTAPEPAPAAAEKAPETAPTPVAPTAAAPAKALAEAIPQAPVTGRGAVDREALAKAFERATSAAREESAGLREASTAPASLATLRGSSGDEPEQDLTTEAPRGEALATPAAPSTVPAPPRATPTRREAQQLARSLPSAGDEGVTLAEQLGLKVRRVVIDPGHGGHDSGALGKKKLMEKDVALQVSLQVAAKLRAEGLEVLLTREDDRFIRLEDRARFANDAHGDLFISIHCNSAVNKKLRGIETYTLNTSSDRYSIRLAARENASSEKGISDLQFILADLATKANTEESSRLATQVQKSLVSHLSSKYQGVKDLGTKEALFYVLLGVRMPAILVETSFISHPEEGKLLGTDKYQADLSQAITHGVLDFLEHRGRLAQVR
ncbi:MAG: N-acetylmuramoyl-L-alanine amidase [Myxococcota bacterium]|nr:N-acetylmuramoyl-L-alanine amidase [Myxococcota bacterium]